MMINRLLRIWLLSGAIKVEESRGRADAINEH